MANEAVGHVAIIMDGNGRWARFRGKPRAFGHRAGAEAVRRTVEAAAVGLRVQVAAAHHDGGLRITPGAPREEVADRVDLDGASGLLAPAYQLVARPAVVVAQRQPADAAARRRADGGQRHQRVPQALRVDLRLRHRGQAAYFR